jgi:hypothetical protein
MGTWKLSYHIRGSFFEASLLLSLTSYIGDKSIDFVVMKIINSYYELYAHMVK